jgi:hypothetical protein
MPKQPTQHLPPAAINRQKVDEAGPGVSRRSAPRRVVVSVVREGGWGDVGWVHVLGCGHVEVRKRAVGVGGFVGCVRCVLAEGFVEGMGGGVVVGVGFEAGAGVDVVGVEVASVESEITSVRLGVASALGVGSDAVDVVWGPQGLQYVMVMLSAGEVGGLVGLKSATSDGSRLVTSERSKSNRGASGDRIG